MGFKLRSFNQPLYEPDSEEPAGLIIISCEGRVTEAEYFKAIKEKLSKHIKALVEVEVVPKDDNLSAPKEILEKLREYLQMLNQKNDIDPEFDSAWLIIDREVHADRKVKIEEIMGICQEEGYTIGLSNPAFEFWLLMHVADISEYDHNKIKENDWVNPQAQKRNRKRFLEDELTKLVGISPKKRSFPYKANIMSIENVRSAIEQEKQFSNDINALLDELGSNIGALVTRILKAE